MTRRGVSRDIPGSMALLPLLVMLALSAACSTQRQTVIPHPLHHRAAKADAERVPENRVEVPNRGGDEALLGLPAGALTSDATLVALDEQKLCADVVVRTWMGAEPSWEMSVRTDRRAIAADTLRLESCNAEERPEACHALARQLDEDRRVFRRAARVCVEHNGLVHTHTRKVELALRQGAYTMSFAWALQ